MSTVAQMTEPVFNLPTRWALRVLSWLAFGVAAVLAGNLILNGTAPGCVVGSNSGCDAVLQSGWSKWLGIPVAFAGLACYSTLAGLSVLLGVQSSASRWITTAFVMLATLAAGASLWFIAVQVFVIGEFCWYCITTDICGIAIGAITAWAAFNSWSGMPYLQKSGSSANTMTALRSAMPTGPRLAPVAATRPVPAASAPRAPVAGARSVPLVGPVAKSTVLRRSVPTPSFPIALGGAMALLVVLIGGQIALPGKSYEKEKVVLNKTIDMSGGNGNGAESEPPVDGEKRVAMRIPAEQESDAIREGEASAEPASDVGPGSESENGAASSDKDETANAGNDSGKSGSEVSPSKSVPTDPKRERKLKFLGDKLTLDVYKHPLIGSPEAPHIVVEMVSYDCAHCRKTHRAIKQAMSRFGDQVALIVLVIPLEKGCNRLVTDPAASNDGACTTARMALGVANLKPESFARFHEYLMSGNKDKPPALASIIAKAYNTVDRTKLSKLRESNELEKQIALNVNLYEMLRNQDAANKKFGLPIQILGDHVMAGTVEKAADVYNAWEEHLGVKPR